ncbi:hypothetical protein Cgig2_003968 [Carnegiea gigantea]|uniref:GRF-like zinc ribbon domain-containing protein n=1 Tax=Carnegiea gigantea TaxID=171969 RepID=A0A9Q1QF62_9CARY|nr:hypothetical protein Cgig2_003968 [Carnegiea gigantea]
MDQGLTMPQPRWMHFATITYHWGSSSSLPLPSVFSLFLSPASASSPSNQAKNIRFFSSSVEGSQIVQVRNSMEASSSSRRKLASEDIAVCQRCNCEGVRKVSHSSQNPGRLYFKCLSCDKFLKWAANEGSQERAVVVDVDLLKKELMEMKLMLKFIEKGQTLIVMLLIVVIVLIVMVVM